MASIAGTRIKKLREEEGISQNRLAKLSGISQSALSAIESSTKSPTLDTVQHIAEALHVTVAFLLEEEQAPPATEEELDNAIVGMLGDLTPEEVQRVQDFIAGMKAGRKG